MTSEHIPPVERNSRSKTKRRGRGEGSVFQRADGLWVCSATIGYTAHGRRIRRTCYGATKKEAVDGLVRIQAENRAGLLAPVGKTTTGEFLTNWLTDVASVKATTRDNYKRAIDKRVIPHIGGVTLTKLRPENVQALYGKLQREGASAYVVRTVHAVLHRALKHAARLGLIPRNPAEFVETPRLPDFEFTILTTEQVADFLEAIKGHRLEALFVVGIASGCRLGELLGLQWRDVDFAGKAISIVRTQQELNGKLELVETKTSKSKRRVDLPDVAIRALSEHRKKMMKEALAGAERVFCNLSGGPLRRSHFHAEHYKPLLAKAGLPPIRFHDLRHTSASLLLSAGAHPKVVQERLGHSQISVTLDRYSHVMKGLGAEAATKLGAIMATKPKRKSKKKTGA